ncbi:hypothetical protein [Nocardia macrotermitis]|uniref:Low molecular weight antigen MTB12-like C-terminal domain-containing protein n=1 Tax=Nocardia macrotermitis TaxID=2585198 RepID=A0A7K0CYY9_9NOCA|nr:hypothetical protein [Nocardia macrotermitis]MQY18695.1 hypothetical protein [Nocardia macrotermitis]
MRDTLFRRTAICAALVAVGASVLAGCGSSNSSSSSSTTAAAASSAAATTASAGTKADAATTQAVTEVFTKFFDAKTSAADKATLVEKGDVFAPVLQAQASNPQAQGTSATVSAVTLSDPTHATVTYSIVMGGTPVLPNQTGKAVQDGGKWKVAAATFCQLLTMQGGKSAACS